MVRDGRLRCGHRQRRRFPSPANTGAATADVLSMLKLRHGGFMVAIFVVIPRFGVILRLLQVDFSPAVQ
jgi:hypothetical protein